MICPSTLLFFNTIPTQPPSFSHISINSALITTLTSLCFMSPCHSHTSILHLVPCLQNIPSLLQVYFHLLPTPTIDHNVTINIIVHRISCLTSSVNQNLANKKELRTFPWYNPTHSELVYNAYCTHHHCLTVLIHALQHPHIPCPDFFIQDIYSLCAQSHALSKSTKTQCSAFYHYTFSSALSNQTYCYFLIINSLLNLALISITLVLEHWYQCTFSGILSTIVLNNLVSLFLNLTENKKLSWGFSYSRVAEINCNLLAVMPSESYVVFKSFKPSTASTAALSVVPPLPTLI